jgi:hypothetical protein
MLGKEIDKQTKFQRMHMTGEIAVNASVFPNLHSSRHGWITKELKIE